MALLAQATFAAGFDLDAVRWQSRVVVVLAPTPEDERLEAQRSALEIDTCELDDRDLIVVSAGVNEVPATALRRRFNVATDEFAVILIGKDGGVKLRSARPVSRNEIFQRIDGMPMRKTEMRASRRKGTPRCGEPKQAGGL